MEEKKPIKISLTTFFLILAIIVIVVMAYFMFKLYNEKATTENKVAYLNNQVNNLQEKINKVSEIANNTEANSINNSISTAKSNIESSVNTEENNTETQRSLKGEYSYKDETNDYYHSSNLVVTNQTNTSIDFELSAVHGADKDHVNIGEVSGTAKKTGTDTYEFEEVIDGKTNKITFKFTAHRMFEYVDIIESYPDNKNPYAGHNVYFTGEYEKIS